MNPAQFDSSAACGCCIKVGLPLLRLDKWARCHRRGIVPWALSWASIICTRPSSTQRPAPLRLPLRLLLPSSLPQVWCVDPQCTIQNTSSILQVVDSCPECKEGDVDMSIPAYKAVTGLWPDRLKVCTHTCMCGRGSHPAGSLSLAGLAWPSAAASATALRYPWPSSPLPLLVLKLLPLPSPDAFAQHAHAAPLWPPSPPLPPCLPCRSPGSGLTAATTSPATSSSPRRPME